MFEITFKEVDTKNILVIDNTSLFRRLPPSIESLKMSITSPRIPGGIVEDLDLVQYMTYHQIDNEMYRVTSEVLNLGAGFDIPDGVYEFKVVLNETEEGTDRIVVLTEIQSKLKTLSKAFDFDVDITDNYIFGNNIPLSNDVLRFLYVVSLYQSLLIEIGVDATTTSVNDKIDKLQRLLSIVVNDI